MSKLWGGRFEKESDPLFKAFNDSLRFDYRLLKQDVEGSIAWAGALERAGILTREERDRVVGGLAEILRESPTGAIPPADATDEDVHSFVEARLVAKVGPLGKKLHTGRSRNDQVATDLRLYTRDEIDARLLEIREAQLALVAAAERFPEAVLPGYTHLQRAQPVLLGHWCLAYVEMLDRDAERFMAARGRTNVCPLGAGALAGTAFSIDRVTLAASMGFGGVTANSLDAVSDRDFVLETLNAAALTALHLSRLAEDLIIYTTEEFGFFTLDDGVTSGSSLMPQKKNPDALELIRGKVGRIIGAQTGLAVTLKGLPLAYNKDLQEDKEPLFDAMDNLSMCLRMLPRVFAGIVVHADRARAAAEGGYANATDLADYLVDKGVPFRDAHEAAGRIVRLALAKRVPIERLSLEEMRGVSGLIESDIIQRLELSSVLAKRSVVGGTAPARVREAVAAARSRVEAMRGRAESDTAIQR